MPTYNIKPLKWSTTTEEIKGKKFNFFSCDLIIGSLHIEPIIDDFDNDNKYSFSYPDYYEKTGEKVEYFLTLDNRGAKYEDYKTLKEAKDAAEKCGGSTFVANDF